MRMCPRWLSKCPRAMRRSLTRVICPCRHIVELYEVINWKDQQPDQWDLAEDTWECDARRIYFYDLAEAPQSIVRKAMIKERDTENGGHGWKW